MAKPLREAYVSAPNWMKFLMVILCVLILSIPVQVFAYIIGYGYEADYTDQAYLMLLRYVQVVSFVFTFLIPALFVAYLFSKNSIGEYLCLKRTGRFVSWIIVLFIVVASVAVNGMLGTINEMVELPAGLQKTENSIDMQLMAFLNVKTIDLLIMNLIVMAVFPAVTEEFIFRGVFQRIFINWTKNAHLGIILAAIFFSAIHFQFSGFLPRFFLGLLLGYLFYFSKSMWLPILAHFINNSLVVIMMFMIHNGSLDADVESLGTTPDMQNIIIVIVSTIVLVGLFYRFYKIEWKPSNALDE